MKNLTEGEKIACRGCAYRYCKKWDTLWVCQAVGTRSNHSTNIAGYVADGTTPPWCPLETAKEVLK